MVTAVARAIAGATDRQTDRQTDNLEERHAADVGHGQGPRGWAGGGLRGGAVGHGDAWALDGAGSRGWAGSRAGAGGGIKGIIGGDAWALDGVGHVVLQDYAEHVAGYAVGVEAVCSFLRTCFR